MGQLNLTARTQFQKAFVQWQRGELENVVAEGGLPQLIDALSPVFGPVRASRIATTETTRLFSQTTLFVERANEDTTHFRFFTANDELVCPICAPLNGKVVEKNSSGFVGIGWPPLHVNCRCEISAETAATLAADEPQAQPVEPVAPKTAASVGVTSTYYTADEVRNFVGRDGKQQDNSWIIGKVGNTSLVYRDMSFTGKSPSAKLLEKYQKQSKAIVETAVERLPQSDKGLIRNIFIEEMKGDPNPFGGAAGASGENMFITSHDGKWQVGPGGIVHEVGHLASFRLAESDAATWLRAAGWDGDYSDPLKILQEATPNNIEWYKYKAVTEYGTVHPGESFAEAYRLAYAPDAKLWVNAGDWDKYEDQIPILTSLIRGFAK